MSLCLCGAAENGKYATIVSDGMLSYGNVSADVDAPKYLLYGDWVFMCAGKLGSTELVLEEIRQILADPSEPDAFSRENIQKTVRRAFNRRVANWSAIRNLSMYGMDMEEFKARGPAVFTPKVRSLLAAAIYKDAKMNFSDELMTVGWGKTPISLMMYVIDKYEDGSYSKDGHCAIGSGREIATSTLLRLKHGMRSSLGMTIYSVVAAKFAAEGKRRGVGTQTDLCLLRKRVPEDNPGKPVIIPVPNAKVDELREIWNREKRNLRIPIEALKRASEIVQLTGDQKIINKGAFEILEASVAQSTSRKPKRKTIHG